MARQKPRIGCTPGRAAGFFQLALLLLAWWATAFDAEGNLDTDHCRVTAVIEERVASDAAKDRRLILEYDGASRLTWEKTKRWDGITPPGQWVDDGAVEYVYDAANNRTWKKQYPAGEFTNPSDTWESIYNGLNQLTTFRHAQGSTIVSTAAYTYDTMGRRQQRTKGVEVIDYFYDPEHRLNGLTRADSTTWITSHAAAYEYDHRARRVRETEGVGSGEIIARVSFSGGTSVRELASSPQEPGEWTRAEYVRGSDWGGGVGGLLYSLRTDLGVDTPRYTHYDGRGDVVLQTNGTGQKTYEAAYEAFGRRTRESGSTPDRQRANTKEENTTFQLLNEGHRYRDLETGVWLTRDPAGFVDGPNLYAYVQQNPWSKFDPEGLAKKWLNEKPDYVAGFERRIEALPIHWSKKHELLDRVRVYDEADSKKFAKRIRHEIDTTLSGYEERVEDDRKTVAFYEKAIAFVPIPQSNADLGVMVAGGPAVKAAGKYLKTAYGWVKGKLAKRGGVYEFPDQKAGGAPYVGQSEDLDTRLKKHESTGRLKPGTETTTDVAGGKTTREVAEHKRIQEITGGMPASKSDSVSNKVDPIGPKRKHLLDDK